MYNISFVDGLWRSRKYDLPEWLLLIMQEVQVLRALKRTSISNADPGSVAWLNFVHTKDILPCIRCMDEWSVRFDYTTLNFDVYLHNYMYS